MTPKYKIKADAFRPIKDNVFVTDLDSGPHKTAGGILLPDDDMTERGIRSRWGRVWAVGPEVEDIQPGEWVLVEHARWTYGIDLELKDETVRVWKIDWPDAVLMASDTDPRENAATAMPEAVDRPKSDEHRIRSKAPAIKKFK